ncbi:MAG: apolipoprotein N-acyltransferase [Alphaproteobacteria bacterium]|nr:apolipoprotein N-acyltransferase [Alphaproteobacteria bacterium]MCB9974882.1 apolipoprotein N-acyltransferase [Rhodospirillales bacterium]
MTEQKYPTPVKKNIALILASRPLPSVLSAFFLGSLSSLSMEPYNWIPLLFIGLGGLYVLLALQSKHLVIFASAWSFGFGYFLFGLSWIANALLVEGNEYAWAYPLALAVLPMLLAFFPAIALYVWRKGFAPEKLSGYLGFTAALGLSEWLRGHLFTGFPWNAFGYSWIGFLPVAQIAALTDIYGLTLLTVFWSAAFGFIPIFRATPAKKIILAATIGLTLLLAAAYGYQRIPSEPAPVRNDISLLLVQPNIAQSEKWEPELFSKHFNTHLDLTESQGLTAGKSTKTTYVIWPESAIPLAFTHHPQAAEMIAQTLHYFPEKTYLLAGAISRPDKESGQKDNYYNSLVAYGPEGKILTKYDKFHLVPFGEYIPYEDELNLTPITGFGGFGRGPGPQTINLEPGFSFSPLICYEIIFPNRVTDATPGNPRPDAIINVTNDGWYGKSAGPYQHLAQARFRAIEEGIPVIRVANTGFSAVIDPFGQTAYRSALYEQEAKREALPKRLEIKNSIPYLSMVLLLGMVLLSITCRRFEIHYASHN